MICEANFVFQGMVFGRSNYSLEFPCWILKQNITGPSRHGVERKITRINTFARATPNRFII